MTLKRLSEYIRTQKDCVLVYIITTYFTSCFIKLLSGCDVFFESSLHFSWSLGNNNLVKLSLVHFYEKLNDKKGPIWKSRSNTIILPRKNLVVEVNEIFSWYFEHSREIKMNILLTMWKKRYTNGWYNLFVKSDSKFQTVSSLECRAVIPN